jgi:hypothetical protein
MVYLPVLLLGIGRYLVGFSLLWQLVGILSCSYLLPLWWSATATIIWRSLDPASGLERSCPVNKVALCGAIIPKLGMLVCWAWYLMLAFCRHMFLVSMEFVVLAVLGCASWSSGVPNWQLLLMLGYGFQVTACSLQRALHKPFNLAFFCSLASEGVVQALKRADESSEGMLAVSARSPFLNSTLTWWIPLLFVLVLWCPSLDKVYSFVNVDIPAAIKESLSSDGASTFVQDINNIMQQQDFDWTPTSEDYHPTSSPPPPVPSTLPPPSRALRPRIKKLLLTTLTILFVEPTTAYPTSSPTTYQAISSSPTIRQSPFASANFVSDSLPWRERRNYERIAEKIQAKLGLSLIGLFGNHSTKQRSPSKTTPTNLDPLIEAFVSQINPAVEAMEWMIAANMDKVLMQRRSLTDQPGSSTTNEERVSVNLAKCKSELLGSQSGFLGAIESVFNSLHDCGSIPLIVDTGASCCLSPNRDDFVTY